MGNTTWLWRKILPGCALARLRLAGCLHCSTAVLLGAYKTGNKRESANNNQVENTREGAEKNEREANTSPRKKGGKQSGDVEEKRRGN